jgi:hypothetical protein
MLEKEAVDHNFEWDMKTRLAFQVKLCEMMGGMDLEKWIEKYGGIFHDMLAEDEPKDGKTLRERVNEELEINWSAASNKESPLLREVADEIIARHDLGKEAEPDEETMQRAA